MANISYAPIVEYYNITAGTSQVIGSGANFRVRAVYMSTDTAEQASVDLLTAAAATMFHFNIVAGETQSIEAPFLADAGLTISATTNNVHVTVLRDHAGT